MSPSTTEGSPAGRLEVITGPMFSGKSEELMRRVRRARIAGIGVLVITHALDTRGAASAITSHIGVNIPDVPVADVTALAELAAGEDAELIAIDEAQFFGPDLIGLIERLLASGTTVLVEGLCVTFDGAPFEPLPSLMALAEDVVKLTAVCTVCGLDAAFHQRLAAPEADDEADTGAMTITAGHIGGTESYAARCRRHFRPA